LASRGGVREFEQKLLKNEWEQYKPFTKNWSQTGERKRGGQGCLRVVKCSGKHVPGLKNKCLTAGDEQLGPSNWGV